MADPYKTLGVEKTATEEDIRKTYKKLAKKHHPDLNPGDKEAEERFKDISAAYALLKSRKAPRVRCRRDRRDGPTQARAPVLS